jgi:uncharacterized membrane protein
VANPAAPVVGIIEAMREHTAAYLVGLVTATAVSTCLVLSELLVYGTLLHSYLIWNLFLAWLPLVLAFGLRYVLRRTLWSDWSALLLTVLWLTFLPNSFYIISDFVHLTELDAGQLLYGIAVIGAHACTGVWLGMSSLYIVHRELIKRLGGRIAASIVGLILLLSSVAIYVGRDLRFNSWDLVFNPFGFLFDVSERMLHPTEYGQVLLVVLPFFALLTTAYFLAWQTMHALQKS